MKKEDFLNEVEGFLKGQLIGLAALAIIPIVFHFIPSPRRYFQLMLEYQICIPLFAGAAGMLRRLKKYRKYGDNEDSDNENSCNE